MSFMGSFRVNKKYLVNSIFYFIINFFFFLVQIIQILRLVEDL